MDELTTEKFIEKWKAYIEKLGLFSASSFFSKITNSANKLIDKAKQSEKEVYLLNFLRPFIFHISNSILFGDKTQNLKTIIFEKMDSKKGSENNFKVLSLDEAFGQVVDNLYQVYSKNPWYLFFEFTLKMNIGNVKILKWNV